jgi:DNA polymerase-3 subunit delta'
MTIVPLFGHVDLRARIATARGRGALPSSLLIQGPRGIGKQRLALWVAQLLLCDAPDGEPCGRCTQCKFSATLHHPDLHWYFPRPRPKDSDPSPEDVELDYSEAIAERADADGLYAAPPGSDGIFVASVRAIVQQAAKSPAVAKRKVFIVGDAERMVPQEGSEQAANAFLKLLEEPPANAHVILTSSEPGSLLPTIRSRVVTLRAAALPPKEMKEFMADPLVAKRLGKKTPADIVIATGAPGRLLDDADRDMANANAERMLEAALAKRAARFDVAWAQASAKARGAFADSLDSLTERLHARVKGSTARGAEAEALAATRAIDAVEVAKERITSNVSPQLVTVNLVRELQDLLS